MLVESVHRGCSQPFACHFARHWTTRGPCSLLKAWATAGHSRRAVYKEVTAITCAGKMLDKSQPVPLSHPLESPVGQLSAPLESPEPLHPDAEPQLILMDLPDDLLLKILDTLSAPQRHATAPACKRICHLIRYSTLKCDILCAWHPQHTELAALLRSTPRVSHVRLQQVPRWITRDSAALSDLLEARRDARACPDTPLWLKFCDRSFVRVRR